MENKDIFAQFEKIEQKVSRLIQLCKGLETKISELKQENMELSQKLKSKNEAEERYVSEKDMIRARIDSLLDKLKDVTEIS